MIRKVYLVHHTHFDIGYTDLPEEVVQQHVCNIDHAIRLAQENPVFRWTLESGSFVEYYLSRRSPEAGEALLSLLRSGQFEVEALNMQMLTETAGSAELVRNVSITVESGRRNGYKVETAMLDDIGGYASYLPSILSQYGVKYFVAGVGACQSYPPWANLPHLFYQAAPDGRRMLVWNLGIDRCLPPDKAENMAVYSQGMVYLMWPFLVGGAVSDDNFLDVVEEHWKRLISRLDRENYPYEELLLQTGLDNGGPKPELMTAVERLKASGRFPEIELITPHEFFELMERKYGDSIPELKGVLTDAWDLRANHVPSVCKNNRIAQRLYQGSLLWGADENPALLHDMMLVADHTFGLYNWLWQERLADSLIQNQHEGMRASVFDRFRRSWETKALYGASAARLAQGHWDSAVGCTSGFDDAVVSVRNSSPHTASGYVECYAGTRFGELHGLKDSDGSAVPFQKIGPHRYIVRADNVPAGGSLSLIPEFSKEEVSIPRPKSQTIPNNIKAGELIISFDNSGLIDGVYDNETKVSDGLVGELRAEDLIDVPYGNKFASVVPLKERHVWREEDASGHIVEDGPIFTVIERHGRIARAVFEERIIIWKDGDGRVDFQVRINKPECAQKESYYVAFPMAHSSNGGIYYDQNMGVVNVMRDLLPGSCQDLFYCSRYAAVEGDGFTSVLCVHDAPVVCFGGMNLCKWEQGLPFNPGNGHIFSMLYNNVCNTDAPCWQDIRDTFSYSLFVKCGGFSPVQAQELCESAMALSCECTAPTSFRAIDGFPKEFRLHPIGKDDFWIENLTDAIIDYDFMLLGRRVAGTLQPRAVESLRFGSH